jgi:hypothetical protein
VTAGTIVIVIQPADSVEEQQPTEIHQLVIKLTTESRIESRLDSTCESMLSKRCGQLFVSVALLTDKHAQQ